MFFVCVCMCVRVCVCVRVDIHTLLEKMATCAKLGKWYTGIQSYFVLAKLQDSDGDPGW